MTPLMAAASGGHVACARILTENKCSLNAVNHVSISITTVAVSVTNANVRGML